MVVLLQTQNNKAFTFRLRRPVLYEKSVEASINESSEKACELFILNEILLNHYLRVP